MRADGRRPLNARCNTDPVIIVQLRLASLEDDGSPARVVYAALRAYFVKEAVDNLVYIDLPYNITSIENAEEHRATMDAALRRLER